MQRRGNSDDEVMISAWSSAWLDGLGVQRVASWFLTTSNDWRVSQVFDIDEALLSAALRTLRASGHETPRRELSCPPPDKIPVIYELNKLRKGRAGPLEERIIEYATSVIPCPVAFHAVDILRPLHEEALVKKRGSATGSIFREVMNEFRALYAAIPLAWALCSTAFSRGPSVKELYERQGSMIHVGMVYISKSVDGEEVADVFHPARVEDVGSGYEVALTKQFGGPMDTVSSHVYEGLWKLLRKVSITGLPWDVLKVLKG